jgi:hypothetical protein
VELKVIVNYHASAKEPFILGFYNKKGKWVTERTFSNYHQAFAELHRIMTPEPTAKELFDQYNEAKKNANRDKAKIKASLHDA